MDKSSPRDPQIPPPLPPQVKFEKDLKDMLYGFGDTYPSNPETLQLIDILTQQYIEEITNKALELSELRKKNLDKDCFLYIIRKESYKFNRISKLLEANIELKKAKTLAECDIEDEEYQKKAKLLGSSSVSFSSSTSATASSNPTATGVTQGAPSTSGDHK